MVVYNPDTAKLDRDLSPPGGRLRWDEFVEDLVTAYESRFEN